MQFVLGFCYILNYLETFLILLQVSRLIYTNQGVAILALAANAVHKLWKWQRNDRNVSGKVIKLLLYMVEIPFHHL